MTPADRDSLFALIGGVILPVLFALTFVAAAAWQPGWALPIGIGANFLVAVDYALIGFLVVRRFSIAAPKRYARIARRYGTAFFFLCSATHLELAVHAIQEAEHRQADAAIGSWFDAWHGLFIHTGQAITGLGFFTLAYFFLGILIADKDTYAQVVDERIGRLQERLDGDGGKDTYR